MRQSGGFGFIELLIALLVFSVGLLGIAAMQAVALKKTRQAYYQSVAETQVLNLHRRLLVGDVGDWNAINAELLPDGHGEYHCQLKQCEIHLQWQGGAI